MIGWLQLSVMVIFFQQLWDIRKKGCIFGYKGHNGTVNSLKFSPDGQWIASGGDDNFVKVSWCRYEYEFVHA